MLDAVAGSNLSMVVESGSSAQDEEDHQFCARKNVLVSVADILMRYLKDISRTMKNNTAALCLKKLFIQPNIPLPASAAAKGLFSCCGLTMNSRRTRVNDELFEDLLVLKVNNYIYIMCKILFYIAYSNMAENVCFDMT